MGCTSSTAVPGEDLSARASDKAKSHDKYRAASKEPESSSSSSKAGDARSRKDSEIRTVNDYYYSVKKGLREGKAPSGPELTAYARYLGMDHVKDNDLLWIAVEALQAPLPADWSEHMHEKGLFYYNCKTRASSWTHPLENLHRQTYRTIVDFRCIPPAEQADELKKLQQEYEKESSDAALDVLDWSQHRDETTGEKFFFNKVLRVSSWTDPRLALTHRLNLQKRMLELLRSGATSGGSGDDTTVRKDTIKRTMSFGPGSEVAAEPPQKTELPPKDDSLGVEYVPRKGKEWQSLCQLLHVADPENLGIGRDVKEADTRYNRLVPVRAWRIQRQDHWRIFDTTRSMVADDLKRIRATRSVPRIDTKLQGVARWLGGLEEDCNEQLLLHGTKPENLLTIIHSGLSEKVSGGLLGHGVYMAEDASKMDQYCTPDAGPGTPGLETLHAQLYPDDHPHPGRCFYALVCRASLGMPVFTKNGKTDLRSPTEAIFRASDRRELSVVPKSSPPISYHSLIAVPGPSDEGHVLLRHREFVVFNCNRIIEQYIIAYTREYSTEPLPVHVDDIEFIDNAVVADDAADEPAAKSTSRCSAGAKSARERLTELKELRDEGLITAEEFDMKKKEILEGV